MIVLSFIIYFNSDSGFTASTQLISDTQAENLSKCLTLKITHYTDDSNDAIIFLVKIHSLMHISKRD